MYKNSLKLLTNGQLDESELILKQLINENIPQLESQGGLPKTMSTIKYSCYINIGRIYLERRELENALENFLTVSRKTNCQTALTALLVFVQASELDNTDVTLWCKIGKLAIKLDRFRQAAYAFSKVRLCAMHKRWRWIKIHFFRAWIVATRTGLVWIS